MAAASKAKEPGDIVIPRTDSFRFSSLGRSMIGYLNIADLTKRQAQIQEQITVTGTFAGQSRRRTTAEEITHGTTKSSPGLLQRLAKEAPTIGDGHRSGAPTGERTISRSDPPSLPGAPSFPNRKYFAAGGLGAGFALALAIMYLIALLDKSMHTERDVEVCLNLAGLTTVPLLDDPASGRKTGLLNGSSLQAAGTD